MKTTKGAEGVRTIWTLAEEAAERAMRGMEATPNEYQRAKEEEPSSDIADAGDLAGG